MERRAGVTRRLLAATALGLLFALLASTATLALAALPGVSPGLATTAAYVLVLTVALSYASYWLGTRRLLATLDPTILPRERYPAVYRRFDAAAERSGVETPRLLVADLGAPNALSFGGRRNGYVVVDPRLFRLLTADELGGVLAHELAHLRRRDSIVQSTAYGVVRTVGTAVYLLVVPVVGLLLLSRRAIRGLLGRPTRGLGDDLLAVQYRTLQATVVVLLGLTLATRAFSRYREFAADDRAARTTGQPLALARALRKIDRAARRPGNPFEQLSIRGDEEGTLTRMFATHPPMERRIDRLRERANREQAGDRVRIAVE